MIRSLKEGCSISIKAVPRASRNAIVAWEGDLLKVRIKAVPEKGDANEMLLSFLSDALRIPKSKIILAKGHTSRFKQVTFLDVTAQELQHKLQICMGAP
jgi:uncharacterized protein